MNSNLSNTNIDLYVTIYILVVYIVKMNVNQALSCITDHWIACHGDERRRIVHRTPKGNPSVSL